MITQDVHAPARADARRGSALAGRLRLPLAEIAIVVTFCCSSMLLTHVGYHYESPGGLPFEKFHPGSLMLFGAFVLMLFERDIGETTAQLLWQHAFSAVFLVCILYYAVYVAIVLGRPISFVVDTLVAAVVAFLLLARTSPARLHRIAMSIHVVMGLNAVIGITEAVLGWRLIPFYLADVPITYDWRSTALLGHPLQNAAISAIYALTLLTGPRGGLRPIFILPAFALQLLALPGFGGRTATVLLGALAVLWLVKGAILILVGKRFRLGTLLLACLGIPLLAVLLLQLSDTAYLTVFVDRFVDDSGSAETRVRMMRLFDGFSWGDLFLGPDPETLAYLQYREGTELGIESFVIAYILNSGIFAASLIFIGLAAFVIDLARVLSLRSMLAVLMFIALNATSTGLASKGIAFILLIAIVMSMEGGEPGTRLARKLPGLRLGGAPRPVRGGVQGAPTQP